MNDLERMGLATLLEGAIGPLESYFYFSVRGDALVSIPNGSVCPGCHEYGGGTVVAHKPSCPGVALCKRIAAAAKSLREDP